MREPTPTTERRAFGHIYRRGAIWWVRYRVGGKTYRESSGSSDARKAQKLLDRKQAELDAGVLVTAQAKRVRFSDLVRLIRDSYRVKGRRTLVVKVLDGREKLSGALESSLAHLETFFDASRALAITTDRVTAYERERLEAGAARSTVNKELACLRRMFNLAVETKRLTRAQVPVIHTPDPGNVRSGFFERDDFERVRAELPEALRSVMTFAYLTGWRSYTEILPLTWDRVDFTAGMIRLEPGTTKTGEGRMFPFDVLPELETLLKAQRDYTRRVERTTERIVPLVFHRNGRPIRSYAGAWRSACRRAATEKRGGLEVVTRAHLLNRIPHDFRRTAVRNLVRAGVPERVAMQLTGHKTRSVFDRYDIVNEADLREGVAKLAAARRGTTGAQSGLNAAGGTQ